MKLFRYTPRLCKQHKPDVSNDIDSRKGIHMQLLRFVPITLLSMTLIGLELTWTRIFSAEFFYTFAFLILSLAVLGLGLGALALRLFPVLNRVKSFPMVLSLTTFSR
jgi:hypothetical protein